MSNVLDAIKNADQEETTLELDNLSLDEIAQLAIQEANGQTPALPQKEAQPKRDDKGRFVAAEEETEEVEQGEEETEQEAPKVFRREIDLGDGSGKQVFEAGSLEDLVEKLANAQANATRKIRDLNKELKSKPKPEPPVKELSADEEFVLAQEMMATPSAAIKKLFKQMVGMDITEFRTAVDRVNAFESAQKDQEARNTAGNNFLTAHPEYVQTEGNTRRFARAVNLLISEAKAEGTEIDYPTLLENAYRDLSENGLFETKSQSVPVAKEPTETEVSRIGKPGEVVPQQRRKGSSISTRGRSSVPAKNTEPTLDDLYSMPLDKLRELANKPA